MPAQLVSFTLARKGLVLLSLTETQCCSHCGQLRESQEWSDVAAKAFVVWARIPSPWRVGEAAAEQHGVYAKQLLSLKPDNWSHCKASKPLPHALRMCALILLTSKGIKQVFKCCSTPVSGRCMVIVLSCCRGVQFCLTTASRQQQLS